MRELYYRLLGWLFVREDEKPACPGCQLRESALRSLHTKFSSARQSQATYDRRLTALRNEHPEIYERYFSRRANRGEGQGALDA